MTKNKKKPKELPSRPCDYCNYPYYVTRRGKNCCSNKCAVKLCRDNKQERKRKVKNETRTEALG